MLLRSNRNRSTSLILSLVACLTWSASSSAATTASASSSTASAFDKAFGTATTKANTPSKVAPATTKKTTAVTPAKNEIVVTSPKAPASDDHADEFARDAENTAADVCRAMVNPSENCKRILKRVDQEERHTALRDQITKIIERVPASKPHCPK